MSRGKGLFAVGAIEPLGERRIEQTDAQQVDEVERLALEAEGDVEKAAGDAEPKERAREAWCLAARSRWPATRSRWARARPTDAAGTDRSSRLVGRLPRRPKRCRRGRAPGVGDAFWFGLRAVIARGGAGDAPFGVEPARVDARLGPFQVGVDERDAIADREELGRATSPPSGVTSRAAPEGRIAESSSTA